MRRTSRGLVAGAGELLRSFVSRSEDETVQLGAQLAQQLSAGDVVLMRGDLGAGKTTFVRGVVRGLGAEDHVSSPTFVLVHEYRGRLPVAHIDLYRLPTDSEVETIGLEEYLDGRSVVLVEWPDRTGWERCGLPLWVVDIQSCGDQERQLSIIAPEGRSPSE